MCTVQKVCAVAYTAATDVQCMVFRSLPGVHNYTCTACDYTILIYNDNTLTSQYCL